jgi:hypothetical protein
MIAVATLFMLGVYWDARTSGQTDYQANLWIALVVAAIGVAGWFYPRSVGATTLPFTAGWLLWAVGFAGVSFDSVLLGAVPLAVSILFLCSGRRRA